MAQSIEERAKSVLHFLDKYLEAREAERNPYSTGYEVEQRQVARNYLGTALVALVTDARKAETQS